jgi:predicted flap endonuclease-1-like 5' DNA nuclease
MKALLRGIVSMAFSTIEDQNTRQRIPTKPRGVQTTSRPVIVPPSPVPANEVYKPLSSSDPIPFGAVTKIESGLIPQSTSSPDAILQSPATGQEITAKDIDVADLVPDNLSQIKGLNPIAIMGLNKRGIVTFLQVANLTDQEIANIEEELDLPGCFNRFSWRYQSRQLHEENNEIS